jgi:hypothetical protein
MQDFYLNKRQKPLSPICQACLNLDLGWCFKLALDTLISNKHQNNQVQVVEYKAIPLELKHCWFYFSCVTS